MKVIPTLLLAVLVSALLLLAPVTAKTEAELEADVKKEREKDDAEVSARSFGAFHVESDKVEIEMGTKTGERKDKLAFLIKNREEKGLEVQFKYKLESQTTESEVKFELRPYRLVEFNNSVRFDSTSTIVKTWNIGAAGAGMGGWKSPKALPEVNGIKYFELETSNGVFKAIGAFTATVTLDANNTRLSPNSGKFSFEVTNFPYVGTNTKLALLAKLKTKSQLETKSRIENGDVILEKPEVVIKPPTAGKPAGFFAWTKTVTADGVDVPILLSKFGRVEAGSDDHEDDGSGDNENRIAYTFNTTGKVTKFVWDPQVGVSYADALVSPASTYSVSITLTLALLFVLALFQ